MGNTTGSLKGLGSGGPVEAAGTDATPSSRAGTLREHRVMILGILFVVDLLVTVVMLATDKNLQTDFGAVSPYYIHWYFLLATGVLDLVAALVLLGSIGMASRASPARSVPRWVVLAGLGWALLVIVGMLGILVTYSTVGFATMGDFEKYLFGVTAYPGSLSYIPWLYDLLLVLYFVTAGAAGFALMRRAA
jgi:hypothetical protein